MQERNDFLIEIVMSAIKSTKMNIDVPTLSEKH